MLAALYAGSEDLREKLALMKVVENINNPINTEAHLNVLCARDNWVENVGQHFLNSVSEDDNQRLKDGLAHCKDFKITAKY